MKLFFYTSLMRPYQNLKIKSVKFWMVLILLLSISGTAGAHSALVKSEPSDGQTLEESPAQVMGWFSEELDSQTSNMRVFDANNRQVDQDDGRVDLNDLDHKSMVVSLTSLPAGDYTVRWTAVSAEDGDASNGEFSFSVRNGSNTLDESSAPSKPSSLVWFIGGGLIVAVFGLAIINISRRKNRK